MKKLMSLLMNERYEIFIDTLNLLILPAKQIGIPYLSSVSYKLEELEGDYYTFLHEDNVQALVTSDYISVNLVLPIAQIRKQIEEVDTNLWNPLDFIENTKWQQIRELVWDLYKQENFK